MEFSVGIDLCVIKVVGVVEVSVGDLPSLEESSLPPELSSAQVWSCSMLIGVVVGGLMSVAGVVVVSVVGVGSGVEIKGDCDSWLVPSSRIE